MTPNFLLQLKSCWIFFKVFDKIWGSSIFANSKRKNCFINFQRINNKKKSSTSQYCSQTRQNKIIIISKSMMNNNDEKKRGKIILANHLLIWLCKHSAYTHVLLFGIVLLFILEWNYTLNLNCMRHKSASNLTNASENSYHDIETSLLWTLCEPFDKLIRWAW